MRKYLHKISLFALMCILSGCVHFYDKSADKLATEAKAGYEDSKIVEALKTEQANFDALEKKEVEAFLKIVAVRRDLKLLSLLSDSENTFVDRFNTTIGLRLSEISASPNVNDKWKAIRAARENLSDRKHGEEIERRNLITFNLAIAKLPKCEAKNEALFKDATLEALDKAINDEAFKPVKLPIADSLRQQYGLYVESCHKLLGAETDTETAENNFNEGELKSAKEDADKRAKDKSDNETAVMAAKVALKQATEAVAGAQKSKDNAAKMPDLTCKNEADKTDILPSADKPVEKPSAPPNAICEALANLKKLGDFGVKVISEEQISKINLTLAALSGASTKEDKEALPSSLALLSTSVRFAGALDQYRTANTLPALEPLLIERQLATSRLAYATQGYELQKLRVALAREKFDALLLELDLLLQAHANLGGINKPEGDCSKKSDEPYCASISLLMSDKRFQAPLVTGEPPRRIAFRALALFSESFSVARARYESADLKLIVSDYRDSLNRSEAALASWDALIATPLAQLQAYYASGVKPEEIAQFLQAFGVVGIAIK
jgi:hypothetical protein